MTFTNRLQDQTAPLRNRAVKVMPGGITRSTLYVAPHPPYALTGKGAHVTDSTGHRVIDCNNNYTALIHGHSVPQITDAVTQILTEGTAFGLPTQSEVQLAELLVKRTGHERWRFQNSGTEAVMTAVRAARAYTGRDMVIRFEGSYHGTSDVAVSFGSPGVPAGASSDVVVVPQSDKAAFDSAVAATGTRLAAVLIDLMPNRAGLVPAQPDFVKHIREVTRQVGALMIIDEVISLRLAAGGFSGRYEIAPDLISAGKIIGGGFPVGAIGGRSDVLEVFDPHFSSAVGWGGTFSANPVTMTAGRIALELFDNKAVTELNQLGELLRAELLEAGVAVSGFGSLLRIREQIEPAKLWWAAYARGAMLGTNGLVALSTAMDEGLVTQVSKAIIGAVRESS